MDAINLIDRIQKELHWIKTTILTYLIAIYTIYLLKAQDDTLYRI